MRWLNRSIAWRDRRVRQELRAISQRFLRCRSPSTSATCRRFTKSAYARLHTKTVCVCVCMCVYLCMCVCVCAYGCSPLILAGTWQTSVRLSVYQNYVCRFGQNRVYTHHIIPCIWTFACSNYHTYTVYIWCWPSKCVCKCVIVRVCSCVNVYWVCVCACVCVCVCVRVCDL